MDIGDKVRIKELKTGGRIVAVYRDSTGEQFSIRYFWNGEAKTVYFFADELDITVPDPYAIKEEL